MSASPTPIVILASGRGSNYEAIARAIAEGQLAARVLAVVSDKPDALVLQKAQAAGHATVVASPESTLAELRKLDPKHEAFLVMAGYMRLVSDELIEAYRSSRGYARITNIHPSLLPAFPGVSSYAKAFRHGALITGVTVHLVEPEMDSGPICAQEAFGIVDCATEADVEARGLAVEHQLYPATLQWVLAEEFNIERRGDRLCVRPR